MSRAETLTPKLPQGFTSNDFAVAARWVKERTKSASTEESIASTLDAVQSIMRRASRGALCITDLLPGLEVLFIPANELPTGKLLNLSGEINQAALADIGHAIRAEFAATNTDMMRLEADESAELIVYAAAVRDVVLAATKVELAEIA